MKLFDDTGKLFVQVYSRLCASSRKPMSSVSSRFRIASSVRPFRRTEVGYAMTSICGLLGDVVSRMFLHRYSYFPSCLNCTMDWKLLFCASLSKTDGFDVRKVRI